MTRIVLGVVNHGRTMIKDTHPPLEDGFPIRWPLQEHDPWKRETKKSDVTYKKRYRNH